MCDYSLHSVKTRPARVNDRITVRDFGTGTRGFCAPEDRNMAVCLLPGTELALAEPVAAVLPFLGLFWRRKKKQQTAFTTAIFRQINKHKRHVHHDALELPNGQTVLLTTLSTGLQATVLQLPAAASKMVETNGQTHAVYID